MKNFASLEPADYLRIFLRRIWYFVGTAVLVSAGAGVYVWRQPSVYKSETTITAASQFIPEDYISAFIKEGIRERIDSVRQVLYSRTFLERIVQEFQLTANGQVSMETAVRGVQGSMELQVVSGNTFKLGYYSTSPETARTMTKRLAEAVIAMNESTRREKVQVADQFLDDQLRQAERDLADSESKIAEFKKQHRDELPDPTAANSLADLQNRLSSAENALQAAADQRKAAELRGEEEKRANDMLMRSLNTMELAGPLAGDSDQASSPVMSREEKTLQDQLSKKKAELAALSIRYTDKFPDLARLKREIGDLEIQIKTLKQSETVQLSESSPGNRTAAGLPLEIPADLVDDSSKFELKSIDDTIARLQRNRNDLSRQIVDLRRRFSLSPDLEAEYQGLIRGNELTKQRYNFLSAKKYNAELAMTVDTSNKNDAFKIIDEANLPEGPVRPNRPQMAGIGVLVAIGLGIGMVFVRELLDPTLGTEEEATAQLRLPVLIAVPEIPQLTGLRKRRLWGGSRPA